jgi:hypothetical protein
MQVPWESDISKLEGDEIKVEILDKFPIATSISHNFVRMKRDSEIMMDELSLYEKALTYIVYCIRFARLSSLWPTVSVVEDCYFKDFSVELVVTVFIKGVLRVCQLSASLAEWKGLIMKCKLMI